MKMTAKKILGEEAFRRLYPERKHNFDFEIKYSRNFNDFNSNVRFSRFGNKIRFNLSRKWKDVDEEIQIGLLQSLMLKIFREKGQEKSEKHTINIDLYNSFIKNLHIGIVKDKSDPVLEESFDRVNKKYFFELVDKPNLMWGAESYRKLGSYDFHTDAISISRALMSKEQSVLDYVMYHEMLHKKEKFESRNGRTHHHTYSFRKKEKQFDNVEEIERKLGQLRPRIDREVRKGIFKWF